MQPGCRWLNPASSLCVRYDATGVPRGANDRLNSAIPAHLQASPGRRKRAALLYSKGNPDGLPGRVRRELAGLLVLAGPLVIHNVAHMAMQFTDTVMAGRLSPTDLGAVAVGSNAYIAPALLMIGTLMALTPTVAYLYGADRLREVGVYVRQGLWLAAFLSAGGVVLLTGMGPMLRAIGVDPELIPLADGYLDAIAWGLPANAIYHVFRFTSEGVSHTRPMLFIALAAVGVNVLLDWVLMYGKLGLAPMGAVGTGWATSLVLWLMLWTLVWYVRRRHNYRPLALFGRFDRPDWRRLGELFSLGFPIGIAIFMEVSLFAATAFLMGTLGTKIVAGHQVAVNFSGALFMVPLGVSMAIGTRVGQALGRGDPHQARFAGWTGIGFCGGFMLVSAVFLMLFRYPIAGIYTEDAVVAGVAAQLLVMAAIFQFSDGIQVGAAGALRGFKTTRVPMVLTVIAYWCIGFPLAWWFGLGLDLGPMWVWIGLIAGLSSAALFLTAYYARVSRRNLHRAGLSGM